MHLNPHHPGWYREFMTIIFFSARRYADALSIAATEPDVFPSSPGWRAAASAYIGRDEDAKHFFLEARNGSTKKVYKDQ